MRPTCNPLALEALEPRVLLDTSFGAQQVITTAADFARRVYACDLDGDGDADVLSASANDDKIAWYKNLGGGSFGAQQVITTAADGAYGVYACDLDGDGDADVLSASYLDSKIAWYENLGGSFGAQQVITTAASGVISVYACDLDGDGDADVLSASYGDDKIAWYENLGGGSFGAQQVITTAADLARVVYACDLDGDGDADALSASYEDDKIAWYENLSGGSFGAQQVMTTAADGAYCVYACDLDGDGDADVLSASVNDDKIAWYKNLGGGSFGAQQVITTAANGADSVYACDLDGDGDADVLSASAEDDKIAWYENLGGGSFGAQQVITTAADGARSVYACDLDGDGDADVLSASVNDDKIAWYENLGAPNVPPTIALNDPAPGTNVNPGGVYTITWTDSDPDDNAVIFLYWDTDTIWQNNDTPSRGTAWDIITTSVWEDDANEYAWTVNAPAGGDCYFRAFIYDGPTSDDDYTSVPVHVNAAPTITPTEIAPGTQRYQGQTYTITWTDSDPDDNAQITLQWDVDTNLANNSPGDEGTTWGTIAAGVTEDDPANSYDWQVDAPAGQYHLWFWITDGYATDSEVTVNAIQVLEGFPIFATHTYSDGVTVRLYDIDPGNGTPPSSTVAWSWAEFVWGQTDVVVDAGYVGDKVINLIMLFGNGTNTADLGIEVAGNNGLGSLIDARTNPQPLGFLASDGYVGTISLGAGMTGVVVEAGQEPAAIYCGDYVRTVIAKGDVNGSLLIEGDLTLLQVLGGDLNGDVTLTGSNVGTVMAIAMGGHGGSINGDIEANGNVNAVMAIGGGISGGILAPSGRVGTVMAINGAITSPTIYGQTGVNLVQAINGGVASAVTSGATLGTVMAIGGNLDLTGGHSISAESTINALMAINGSILGDGAVSPDIYVGNGNLSSLQAVGGGMQNVWVDVNGSGASAGRLSSVYVGGTVSGSRFEVEGLLSSLFAQGNFTNSSVQAGSLSVVYVGGTISEDSTDGDTDAIHADAGSYYVIDSTKFTHITPTAPATFGGLIASVA